MYTITHTPFGRYKVITLRNEETGEYASVIPEYSAQLNALGLKKKDTIYQLVNGSSSDIDLLDEGKRMFKGSKLSPFPNRIKEGKYTFNGQNHQLNVNFPNEGNAIHGLVLEASFKVIEEKCSNEGASLTLGYKYKGEEKGFPFRYDLTIRYTLTSSGLTCITEVRNTDSQEIPMGDGWHPYFTTGTKVDNLNICLPSTRELKVDKKMIPDQTIIDSNQFKTLNKINSHSFDTCYEIENQEGIAEVIVQDPVKDIELIIWQETGKNKYNYLQVYTPPSRTSIAIEPMTCMPDAFNNKKGLIILKPNQIVNFAFGVKLQ